jgi:DNA repair exonuclease SbcCD ATPase subunit
MLKHLHLKNFRRHEDLSVDFTRGLNTLRGANESGKTTILEAILYALYGSRTLRSSLAEAVTRGMQEKDLKVELTLFMQGKEIRFERSKAGAQVVLGTEVFVTGQNEVSAYAAELLGADAKTAAMLMMAGQADLRGALAEGPAAVSALIGKLADFDLIDRILESAQANLLMGADAQLRDRLSVAEAELMRAEQAVPADTSGELEHSAQLEDRDAAEAKELIDELHQPAADAAAQALSALRETVRQRGDIQDQIAGVDAQIRTAESRLIAARLAAKTRPAPEEKAAAQAALDLAKDTDRVRAAYAKVSRLPSFPSMVWEGSHESFLQEIKRLEGEGATADRDLAVLHGEIQGLIKQKITSGKCPTCGHAAVSDNHVAEHNGRIDALIGPVEDRRMEATRRKAQAVNSLQVLQTLAKTAAPFLEAAKLVTADLGAVDDTTFPPMIHWTAGHPDNGPTTAQAQAALAELEKREQQALRAEGEVSSVEGQIVQLRANRGTLESKLVALPVVDLVPAEELCRGAQAALSEARSRMVLSQGRAAALRQQVLDLRVQILSHQRALTEIAQRITDLRQDIETIGFNNALMAKLRKLKPAITDHLWSIVLSSVSTFFSQQRGQISVVTKDATGFKVDGYGIESLSGSTLDALAIAVRVALTLTFIPHAPFLVLDEPAHGCDRTRTSNILGFLASTGVPQLLVASHDELSESVADHVIVIGD